MKPQKPIPRISAKRLSSLKGKPVFSTIRKKSRKPSEFKRIYGSKARVEFVKSLPCAACGVVGYSENAHVPPKGEAGTGYKAGYQFIAPLCGVRDRREWPAWAEYYIGCHSTYDNFRGNFDARFPDFDPAKAAADTESLWLAHLKESTQ